MERLIGQSLGNYILTHFVGRGPFSEVYQGEQHYLSTFAAIKVPLKERCSGDKLLYKRAYIQSHLTHPNILYILYYEAQDTPFLVMNFASGGSLQQALSHRQHFLEPVLILSYTMQIAEALDYAHSKQVVHGNLKPENILFNNQGTLFLSDFDVSISSPSQTSAVLDALRYTAPEQREGKTVPASDQYVLACLVYEWLSGQSPFTETDRNVLKPNLTTPRVSGAVEEVLRRAMKKDVQQRYRTVKDFATALEQAIGSKRQEPLSPLLSSLPSLPTAQRLRMIALTLLFLLISGGFFVNLLIKPSAQPLPTPTAPRSVDPMVLYTSVTRSQPSFGDAADSQSIIHWATSTDRTGDGCKLTADGLHLILSKLDLVPCFVDNLSKVRDFAFQIQMTILQGEDIYAGLLLRADPNGVAAYRFFLDTSKYTSKYRTFEYYTDFQVMDPDGTYASDNSDGSSAIKSGLLQSNILTCIARKNLFYLYVNSSTICNPLLMRVRCHKNNRY